MKNMWKKMVFIMALALTVTACGKTADAPKVEVKQEQTAENKEQKQEEGKEAAAEGAEQVKNKGVTAPDFSLTDMDGNVVSMSDLKGKKVYIKFWASWCDVCTEHMPELEELVKMDKDFEVYTVVADKNNGEKEMEDFKKWFADKGYSKDIKVLFDNEEFALMRKYGIRAFPTNAFIGSDGVLVGVAMGGAKNEEILEVMKGIK